jgi:hypothetical protein
VTTASSSVSRRRARSRVLVIGGPRSNTRGFRDPKAGGVSGHGLAADGRHSSSVGQLRPEGLLVADGARVPKASLADAQTRAGRSTWR